MRASSVFGVQPVVGREGMRTHLGIRACVFGDRHREGRSEARLVTQTIEQWTARSWRWSRAMTWATARSSISAPTRSSHCKSLEVAAPRFAPRSASFIEHRARRRRSRKEPVEASALPRAALLLDQRPHMSFILDALIAVEGSPVVGEDRCGHIRVHDTHAVVRRKHGERPADVRVRYTRAFTFLQRAIYIVTGIHVIDDADRSVRADFVTFTRSLAGIDNAPRARHDVPITAEGEVRRMERDDAGGPVMAECGGATNFVESIDVCHPFLVQEGGQL
jgi:hypothetical protein